MRYLPLTPDDRALEETPDADAPVAARVQKPAAKTVAPKAAEPSISPRGAHDLTPEDLELEPESPGKTGPVALVFGSEVRGLTTDQVKRCQMVATILTDASHSSLNLAAAVQVFAYELRLHAVQETIKPTVDKPRVLATHQEIELFYEHLERELMACGFLNPAQPKRFMQRVRRMFARMQLEHDEVKILRGVVRTLRTPKKR